MKLTITKNEFSALRFVGYRYDLGELLLEDLVEAKMQQDSSFDWDTASQGFTVNLTKEIREDIYHCLLSDMQRGKHPLLADFLIRKFQGVALEPECPEVYSIPIWALSPLINCDWGDLDEDEEKILESFLNREKISSYDVWSLFSGDEYYSKYNDIDNKAGTVMDLVLCRMLR